MIIATNVNKRFGKLKALDNVSFTCNKGQTISLIGPNGSGKTTFIKCLLGMVVRTAALSHSMTGISFMTGNTGGISAICHRQADSRII
jgi:ABC-type branched-subunit amino acid transport system ATPase component